MKIENALSEIENLFLALADKTRLRLLNLMRTDEVCVGDFTEVLGESQPKISRHLSYLRNAGVVSARRDGKRINYKIVFPKILAPPNCSEMRCGGLRPKPPFVENTRNCWKCAALKNLSPSSRIC